MNAGNVGGDEEKETDSSDTRAEHDEGSSHLSTVGVPTGHYGSNSGEDVWWNGKELSTGAVK